MWAGAAPRCSGFGNTSFLPAGISSITSTRISNYHLMHRGLRKFLQGLFPLNIKAFFKPIFFLFAMFCLRAVNLKDFPINFLI